MWILISVGLIQEQDVAHKIVHVLGDSVGYWWLLGLIAVGTLVVFRKRISKFLK